MTPRKQKLILTFIALACVVTYVQVKGQLEKQLGARYAEKAFSVKPVRASFQSESLRRYNFGFRNFIAGLTWVDLLQRHESGKIAEGEVSWEFAQLQAITELDPRFYRAYDFGSVYLSVLRGDKLGAKLIMEKWIAARPYAWRPRYIYSYHLIYEMNDFEEASKQVFTAASMEGAPYWLHSLGVRLVSEGGAYSHALNISLNLYADVADVRSKERLEIRIRTLNYYLQERAWKKAVEAFRQEHGTGPSNLANVKERYKEEMRKELAWLDPAALNEEQAKLLSEQFPFTLSDRSVASLQPPKDLQIDTVGIHRPKQTTEKETEAPTVRNEGTSDGK